MRTHYCALNCNRRHLSRYSVLIRSDRIHCDDRVQHVSAECLLRTKIIITPNIHPMAVIEEITFLITHQQYRRGYGPERVVYTLLALLSEACMRCNASLHTTYMNFLRIQSTKYSNNLFWLIMRILKVKSIQWSKYTQNYLSANHCLPDFLHASLSVRLCVWVCVFVCLGYCLHADSASPKPG